MLRVLICSFTVAINEQPFASIRCDGSPAGYVHLAEINFRHPILTQSEDPEDSVLSPLVDLYGVGTAMLHLPTIPLQELSEALPHFDVILPMPFERSSPRTAQEQYGTGTSDQSHSAFDETEVAISDAIDILSQLLIGPGKVLADYLAQLRYVGPLRSTPPRNYLPARFPDESRWADGMAAWDELSRDAALTMRVGEWLSDTQRLDAGCSLVLQRYRLLEEDSDLYRLLASGRAFDDADDLAQQVGNLPVEQRLVVWSDGGTMLPQDVGVGISQLLPVVVALLSSGDRPIALEQPELHVHPRLQAEIADVLIEASRSPSGKQLFVETHSEHLILRLLRRIRETTEKELPSWHPGIACEQLSVIYLTGGGAPTKAVALRVTHDGDFLDRWPNGFFEERAEELF